MAVIGVVGGSGGIGASSFAAVLAWVWRAVLIDLDGVGGGIDVLLGIESVPGARWSALRLGGGVLDPGVLVDGLPRWGPVPVLAADVMVSPHTREVLAAASRAGPVVVDLPREPSLVRDEVAARCSLVVALVGRDVRALVAARSVVTGLPDVPVGLVLCPGVVPARQVGQYVTGRVLGVLRRPPGVGVHGPSRAAARLAAGIVKGASAPAGSHRTELVEVP